MHDWVIPLVVGALIAGGVLVVPLLMRSKFSGSERQANNSKSDALSPNPNIVPPDQNIVSDPKNWLHTMGREAMRIMGWVAIGIIAGVILLIVVVLPLRAMLS